MSEIIHVLPADIEKTSFRIIEEELRQQGREIPEDKKHVILRVIHTTADFEYLDTLVFSESVLDKASDAIRMGAHIVTDTTMAMSGVEKTCRFWRRGALLYFRSGSHTNGCRECVDPLRGGGG